MKQHLSFGLKATRYPRFLGKTPRHERQGKPKGKKGFLTGLSAVLLFSALATLFAVEQMRTHQQESDLLIQEALAVHQRFLDTAPFANQTIADALLDSAVAAHGCVPGGGFCAQLPAKATSYLIGSSGLLSQDGIFVNATSAVLECANGPQNPGFDVAYTVVTNLTINASLPDAKKTSSFVQAWLLDVNTTLHRVVVRSPDTQRDVTFTCP